MPIPRRCTRSSAIRIRSGRRSRWRRINWGRRGAGLGRAPPACAAGGRLAYTRSGSEAVAAVARGDAKAAILVRPTRLEQLAAVAIAGDVMPQKSTYFYPKLLTGMVFNPLEDA